MGAATWSVTAGKLCDSCKASPAAVFCGADSAFLCPACDGEVHAANRLASRHSRVRLCDVCEQAPAVVTCRADAATLCSACDRDIHSANPLARRHQRHPIAPFYEGDADFSEDEAEAASWLADPGSPVYGSTDHLFSDPDPDLDLIPGGDRKQRKRCIASADRIVPVGEGNGDPYPGPVVNGYPSYDPEYPKPFLYNFTLQGLNHSVSSSATSSSSSMDVSIVPDHNSMVDVSAKNEGINPIPPVVSGVVDREARVLRYKEKRKNRKFEKTIRYASRKAYAETRPRIKGRFAKRTDLEIDSLLALDASYGVVPTF